MAYESTITEHDMDPASQQFTKGLRGEQADFEPDLMVEGMTESFLSRMLGLFGGHKS